MSATAYWKLRPGQALLGVSRIYSNIVPHASVPHTIEPGSTPIPLLQTSSGATDGATIGMLSVMVWRHMNSTYAVSFRAGQTLWRRAHTNRVDLRYDCPLTFSLARLHARLLPAVCGVFVVAAQLA